MSMQIKEYKLAITFTGPLLGTQPGKETPAADYLLKKAKEENPDLVTEDEEKTLPETLEAATTGFHRDEKTGKPILYNYQIKGLLKECGEVLNGSVDGIKNMRSKIDNTIFVFPRTLTVQTNAPVDIKERPLRAMTMQGPRVSLARSEMIAEGARVECIVKTIETAKIKWTEEHLRELLDYGQMKGIGQWRNSGIYGQFEYELTEMNGKSAKTAKAK